MADPLDRPIWTALTTRQAHLAEGDAHARRYLPDISPFTATRDDSEASLAPLARLAEPAGTMLFLQASPVVLPPQLVERQTAEAVQMIAEAPFAVIEDRRVERLGPADAEAMLALAELTKPGPFTLKAQSFGAFWGVREEGRLIAMAGERLKLPGITELSGLATHPDRQGEGLGKLLLTYVAGQISAGGDAVFLHAYAWNEKAIQLYERLGFRLRSAMHVAVVELRSP
ncbi:GNAT family N-acetyltransferase [Aurantimonas sp. 22II-16-19i]|uniref:GNAT family N-acetyltransferase n=1 Tax=Aurantimonas sp. 22II-16-19i TaxID=1317114 RepID=UPI0009F7BD75|nr:GNAT family N-acetyltransferase [Aurantimonas sp. 22II-16-19i]ORE98539.1 N-acetyltransferase GCN5 [Aurantimonas sp. 22II-16-19i]